MTAPIALRRRGRQPAIVEDLRDRRDDLAALRAEVRDFIRAALPMLRALTPAMHELGPRHGALRDALEYRVLRLARQWGDPDDPGAEAVA